MAPEEDGIHRANAPTEVRDALPSARLLWTAVLSALLVTVIAGYILFVRNALFLGVAYEATFEQGTTSSADGIDIAATVLTIDPLTNTFHVRLDMNPVGKYQMTRKTPNRELDVFVNAANGGQSRVYPAGRPIELSDVTVDAVGDTVLYPFDRHTAALQIQAFDETSRPVPVKLTVNSEFHDWRIHVMPSAKSTVGELGFDIVATRSVSVISLAVALMTLVVMLVLVTVGVVVRSVRDPRSPDFAIVASLVALLFAIPALRSSLPNAPPPGTLSDFLVFFWALLAVGVMMVVLSLVYIRRYGK
jgi:hypothetical protein